MRPAVTFSSYLPFLPLELFIWWYSEGLMGFAKSLWFIFRSILQYLAIGLIFKTFFKPWKNEYRKDLARFAVFFGIGIKSMLLFFDFFIILGLLALGVVLLAVWVGLPLLILWGIYAAVFL